MDCIIQVSPTTTLHQQRFHLYQDTQRKHRGLPADPQRQQKPTTPLPSIHKLPDSQLQAVATRQLYPTGMNESYRLSQENLSRSYQRQRGSNNMNNSNDSNVGGGGGGVLDEKILVELLSISSSRQQALHYIDQNLTRNGNLLTLLDRGVLFEQFHRVLSDARSPPLQIQCTMLISKIIPLLHGGGGELDTCMQKVLSRIISNIGSTVKLQKESIQTIHVYMKHTSDFQYIIHSLAYDGLRHKDKKTRHQVVVSFPALLFPEFRHKDFFDIVHTLVLNMDESYVDKEILRKVWKVLKEFLGVQTFNSCVDRLPNPLKTLLRRQHVIAHNVAPAPIAGVGGNDDDDDDLGGRNLAWSPDSTPPPVLRPHGLRHRKSDGNMNQFGISFVSKELLEDLASSKTSTRVQAAERLKDIIESLKDTDQLRACLSPLVSILQPVVSDKNVAVVCAALQTIQAILRKISFKLNSNLEMFVSIVLIQIASASDTVRSECMKVCLQMMHISGVLKVVDSMWKKFQLARFHAREEMVNVITAALIRWDSTGQPSVKSGELTKLTARLSRLLLDKNPNVRLATMECFAVIANFHTSRSTDTLSGISNSINAVEMQNDNAFGMMSAVNARIVRKLLPTLNKQLLIEYSNFHLHASPQSADVQWIAVAGQVKKRGSIGSSTASPKSAESTHGAGSPFKQSLDKTLTTRNSADTFKKHLTKQSTIFPWTTSTTASVASTGGGSTTEGGVNKHPNSAPVQASRKHLKELPPVHPRQTWESDGDLTAASTSARNNNNGQQQQQIKHFLSSTQEEKAETRSNRTDNETTDDLTNTSSYRDLHMKKKGQYSLKHSGSPLKRIIGYKPSFANTTTSATTGNNNSIVTSQQQQEGGDNKSLFSNSCPSSFFEMTTSKLKANAQAGQQTSGQQLNKSHPYHHHHHPPSPSVGKPTISHTTSLPDDDRAAIMTKPALVRSASKNRNNANRQQQQQANGSAGTTRSRNIENLMTSSSHNHRTSSSQPGTMTSSQALPQQSGGGADMTTSLASDSRLHSTAPRRSIFFNSSGDDVITGSDDDVATGNYTPTAVQAVTSSTSTKPRLAKLNNNNSTSSSSSTQPQRSQLSSGEVTGGKSPPIASHPSAVESKFMPSHHRHKMMTSSSNVKNPSNVSPSGGGGIFDKEIPEKSQMTSIRRSAQDKRQRMLRSQPSNDILSSTMSYENSRTASSAQSSFRSGGMLDQLTRSEFSVTADESLLSSNLNKLNLNKPPPPPTTTTTTTNNNTITSPPPLLKPSVAKEDVAIVGVRMDYVDHNERPLPVHNSDHHFNDGNKFIGTSSSSISMKNEHPSAINVQGRGVHFSPQKKSNSLLNSSPSGGNKSENNENLYQTWSPTSNPANNNKRERKKFGSKTESFSSSVGSGGFPTWKHSNDEFPLNDSSNNETDGAKKTRSIRRDKETREDGTKKIGSIRREKEVKAETRSNRTDNETTDGGNTMKRLENPERAMQQAITSIESADAEEWEQMTKSMFTIQRLSTFHSNVLATKFSQIIRLLSKQVSNLRSQVSRNSVVTIHSIYTNLSKPVVDVDLEVCVGALVMEYGKTNVFMREEISKALNAILDVATSNRFLSTILNTGIRHKNKDVRNATACYTAKLVNKLGSEKVFNREFAERIFEATASYIMDSSPDVRYHGKCIINDVMRHPRFRETLEQCLNKTQVNDMIKCATNIQERGLTSSQSSGGYKRTYQRPQAATTTSSSAQEPEEVKEILARISKGDLQSKREGMHDLFEKVFKRPSVSDNSVKKIMDTFIILYSTSNSKANLLALENSARLIDKLQGKIPRENLQSLLPVLFKLTVSKHGNLAKDVIDLVISRVDNSLLVQPFANQAQYAHGRARQFAMEKLTELVTNSGSGNASTRVIQRHVFPVLWNAMMSSSATSSAYLRREVGELARKLYELAPGKLLEEADHKNLLQPLKQLLHIST